MNSDEIKLRPPPATSSFKDRLAKWNQRDSETHANGMDIVRLGQSNDFVRLGAKKRYSVNKSPSWAKKSSTTSTEKSADESGASTSPSPSSLPSPILMRKMYSPVLLKSPKIRQLKESFEALRTDQKVLLAPPTPSKNSIKKLVKTSTPTLREEDEQKLTTSSVSESAIAAPPRSRKALQSTRKLRTKSVRANHLKELNSEFRPPVSPKNSASEKLLRKALLQNFVFEQLAETAMTQLIQAFEPTSPYHTDEAIIRQGEEGDYFYVIQSGAVSFEVNGTTVGSAKAGTSFGELALLYTCPRAATVISTTDTKLWRLEQTVFRYVLQSQTKVSKAVKRKLLQNIDFFSEIESSDVQQCVNVMTPRRFDVNEVIVKKGDDGDAFYVVESGELKVTDISVGEATYDDVVLGAGNFFGERALVKSEPRAANVIGVKAGTLFSIDRRTFEKVCGSFVRIILKSQDKSRLGGLKVVKAAKLDVDTITELSQYLGDEMYREGKQIFCEGKSTSPALYLVREGRIRVRYSDGIEKIIQEGGYFGEDHLLADALDIVSADNKILAKYSASALDHNSICGVLTLTDCRKVFDTKHIELDGELAGGNYSGMAVQEEDEFRHMVGRRSSQRSSIDMASLRGSLTRGSVLGEGQFGEVWEVTSSLEAFEDTTKFALKIQSKEDSSRASYSAIEAIQRECQVMSTLDHPFIVDLIHHYEDEQNYYMVLGIIKGGELWSVIHREGADGEYQSGIPESQAKFYSLIIADTLDFMHHRRIAFRDLKPENVMIDEEGYPIIVDFGFAKVLEEGVTYTFCGTPQYLCPEITTNAGHGFAVDFWALGVVIYEMIAGESPFFYEGIDNLKLFNDICKEEPFPLPDEATREVRDLIDRLLEKDPTQRIGSLAKGAREIKMHPWFEGLDLTLAREKMLKAPFIPKL